MINPTKSLYIGILVAAAALISTPAHPQVARSKSPYPAQSAPSPKLLESSSLPTDFRLEAGGSNRNGDLQKRRDFLVPQNRAKKFQTAYEAFPYRAVHGAGDVYQLRRSAARSFSPRYSWEGKEYGIDEHLTRTHTSAILILKGNDIIYEKYLQGSGPRTQFFSFSAAKSITSTLVGLAIQDGYIKDLNDPLATYAPFLSQGPYAKVTIKQALQMLSGIAFDEATYDFNNQKFPFSRAHTEAIVEQRYRFVEAANTLTRTTEPDKRWIYNTMNTALLGVVLENATGKRVAKYMEERLWKPAGMEGPALWYLDGPPDIGREQTGGNFSTTLRNYARYGRLFLTGKNHRGEQIIPKSWIEEATHTNAPPISFGNIMPGSPLGYGYGWWLHPDGLVMAQGVHGQILALMPKSDIVIMKVSHWPDIWSRDLEMESYAFFKSVEAALEKKGVAAAPQRHGK